jgi:hypothetical protein
MEKRMYLDIYLGIAMLAYFVVLFLTLRDVRIFRRTGYRSYRKGAIKGLMASTVTLIGAIIIEAGSSLVTLGLLVVLLGLYLNRKGVRERVFTNAGTLDRVLGKTDYVKKKK